jgi:hypothetical protein
MRIEAKMPPGAENFSTIISTTELSVREAWHPKPGPAKVGDAFTRKITFRAPNVMGMAFPPLSMENVAGLGVYPKEPVVRDYTQRGEFTGERTETITYVCEREGTSTLPGLVIQWWDLKNEKLRRVELQPVTFEVAPNPALTPEAEPAPLPSQSTGFPWWVLGVAVLVVIGAILLTKYRHALVLRWKERQARLAESEVAYFKRFRSASRSGNLSQIMQTLLSWLDRCIFSGQTASLEDFVLQTDDPKLAEQIENLESMLYGRSRALDLQESWSGKRFYKAVSRARRRLGRSATSFQPKPRGLPDLNPQSW